MVGSSRLETKNSIEMEGIRRVCIKNAQYAFIGLGAVNFSLRRMMSQTALRFQ